MATKQQEVANESVLVSFSNNSERVKKAIDKVAYEAAVEQVANIETQRALKLRDQGKIKEAEQALTMNANVLNDAAELISSPRLFGQSIESEKEAEAVKDDKNWNESRKAIKAKTYKRAKQQERGK